MLVRVVRELVGCAVLGALGALAACTSLTGSSIASNTVSTFSPVTTVEVDSASLLEREGCGTTAGVPYKYVATIYPFGSSTPLEQGITISDCWTNAVFENLPTGATGEGDFTLTVDVFDLPTFQATQTLPDGGTFSVANANENDEATVRSFANWTSNCTAHQTANVQSLAVCDPLTYIH
jgi:hypothetical protein